MRRKDKVENEQKTISILGSTGSIGTQAIKVCEALGFRVRALAARSNVSLLEQQARRLRPALLSVSNEEAWRDLRVRLADTNVEILLGTEGMCEIAAGGENDLVLNSVVGMVGLRPTLAALEAGKDVALANKETLVAAGGLVTETARRHGARLIPVDSEHSAIFQCLCGNDSKDVRRLLLTASGGPFFGRRSEELEHVMVEDALRHPNWQMGAKITVDCATMMNKGLEFIEAMWLFGVAPEQIEILVHRESVVHSMVEYRDGAVMAQLGVPDMAIPIQYALTFPRRLSCEVGTLDLFEVGKLTFQRPDYETFRCLGAALEAAKRGGLSPCVVNAANEAAVALFLERKIGFMEIARAVCGALEEVPAGDYESLDEVLEAARRAQDYVNQKISQ